MAAAAFPRSGLLCATMSIGVLLVLSGCGSNPYVAGKVTYKDKPLTYGTVSFVGQDGKKQAASIVGDGSYKLMEPPLGTVKVCVEVKPIKLNLGKDKDKKTEKEPLSPIPAHYADPSKSGLTTEIKEGANTYDIELKEGAKESGPKDGASKKSK